jgi:hypothetical protein
MGGSDMNHQTFWHWLFRRFRFIPGLIAFLPVATYLPNLNSLATPDQALVEKGFILQALVLSFYWLWLFGYIFFLYADKRRPKLKDTAEGSQKKAVCVAREAADQFSKWFVGLLASWIFLYFYLWLFPLQSTRNTEFENVLNNLNSCFILACYYTLGYYTVAESTPGSQTRTQIIVERRVVLTAAFVILIGFLVAQVLLDAYSFTVGSKFVTWVSGAVGGVLTALLADRLCSRSIKAPLGLQLILYVYSTIQFSWAFFMADVTMQGSEAMWFKFVMPIIALIGKSVLFLLVFWMLETNRLDFYMWRARNVLSNIERDEQEFSEYFAPLTTES